MRRDRPRRHAPTHRPGAGLLRVPRCGSGAPAAIDFWVRGQRRRLRPVAMMSENEPVSISLAEIEQQARKLSAEDRARLVEAMLQSLQDSPASEIEAAWQQEIRDRVAAYDRGESRTYPAEDVFAEARHIVK